MSKQRWYFASCTLGLEAVLAAEIIALGATEVRADRGGVAFRGDQALGYQACLWTRSSTRVLEELQRGKIHYVDDIYTVARRIKWEDIIAPGQTFAVFSAVRGTIATHSHYAALKVKDAIVDHLRELRGERPSVDKELPDVPLKLVVQGKVATIARDLAGDSLHKRGYRPQQHKSPLNEAIAAGLLLMSDWDQVSPLCDPMCGSGTFLIEAALLAGDRAPGLRRSFAFERFSDFDAHAWSRLLHQAEERWSVGRTKLPTFLGNDRHPASIAIATRSAKRATVGDAITFDTREVCDYSPHVDPAFVLTNPPYGVRIGGDEAELQQSWYDLGQFLKRFPGLSAWILSGEAENTRHLQLRAESRTPVWNGPIETRWLHYTVRERRKPTQEPIRNATIT